MLSKSNIYNDLNTRYNIYTEFSHIKRNKCCGRGYKHCPYDHVNVKDKVRYIPNPVFFYDAQSPKFSQLFSIPLDAYVKSLFFSGGKDLFLAIRKLVKQRQSSNIPFPLILLTTFDFKIRDDHEDNLKQVISVINNVDRIAVTFNSVKGRNLQGNSSIKEGTIHKPDI